MLVHGNHRSRHEHGGEKLPDCSELVLGSPLLSHALVVEPHQRQECVEVLEWHGGSEDHPLSAFQRMATDSPRDRNTAARSSRPTKSRSSTSSGATAVVTCAAAVAAAATMAVSPVNETHGMQRARQIELRQQSSHDPEESESAASTGTRVPREVDGEDKREDTDEQNEREEKVLKTEEEEEEKTEEEEDEDAEDDRGDEGYEAVWVKEKVKEKKVDYDNHCDEPDERWDGEISFATSSCFPLSQKVWVGYEHIRVPRGSRPYRL
ncbi:hypothetical protein GOODEAATRI_031411 [Goodea atripinnis]|uniref:Uncharacterized protein n=1 Tax=Goodea atripinnis TaxID=208336 RepID=A0ABV0NF72_9TELE